MRAKRYTYNGETKTLKEWGKQYSIAAHVLNERIRRGYSMERALNEKVKRHEKRTQGNVVCPYPNCDDCPYPDCRW